MFLHMSIWMTGKNSMKIYYLNMDDITDADCTHAKIVCKDFEIKCLGEYHDLYVQNDSYWYSFYNDIHR